MPQTQNVLLIFVSDIGGELTVESGNEAVTHTRQLNSAQLNAMFKSNAELFKFKST